MTRSIECHEFEAPDAKHGPAREITPAFIMDLFPTVKVVRNIQGNGLFVSIFNDARGRWQIVGENLSGVGALAVAARFNV